MMGKKCLFSLKNPCRNCRDSTQVWPSKTTVRPRNQGEMQRGPLSRWVQIALDAFQSGVTPSWTGVKIGPISAMIVLRCCEIFTIKDCGRRRDGKRRQTLPGLLGFIEFPAREE